MILWIILILFTISQHLVVTGGYDVSHDKMDSTEIYSFRDNVWTEAGKLPVRMTSMRAATLNNSVLLFGN